MFSPIVVTALLASGFRAQASAELNVRAYGAVGDGRADDTAAFQRALDEGARQRGIPVYAPPGNYRFLGTLNVPSGVTLRGSWTSVPSHIGIRNPAFPKPTDDGTTLLVESGEGSEDGAPFLTLNTNSTLTGVLVYYPKQDPAAEPKPYPYAIAMRGKNPAVLGVELLNPYNGIDASLNERHLIRDVSGQPLHRGIFVDVIYDTGRVENVHFNPWWSMRPKLLAWQQANGEAFVFGRSDWEYVFDTFCFGYSVGYHFVHTATGECNGNFTGIGADSTNHSIVVDRCAPFGLLITNGEFTSFTGDRPTSILVTAANTGAVQLQNCAFWGPATQIASLAGGNVSFSNCQFWEWDRDRKGLPAIECLGGVVRVVGCNFARPAPQLLLSHDALAAVFNANTVAGRLRLLNQTRAQIAAGANVVVPEWRPN